MWHNRGSVMKEINTILLTTDFSETSKKAFEAARGLAEKYGAKLILAYVEEEQPPTMVVEFADVGIEQVMARQRELSTRRLEDLAAETFPDLDVETKITVGIPHLEIVRLAGELGVDLIVMTTHGRGFFSHAILGSTTERVVRRAPCPVLVVRDTLVE
jgi:nucleotide-binding universal stress UspA family protein